MAYDYAGLWGPETLITAAGRPMPGAEVRIYTDEAATTLATIYEDRLKSDTVTQPILTDEFGNLSFFAAPGFYYLAVTFASIEQFTVRISVLPDNAELNEWDHDNLGELSDNDHPQYTLKAGDTMTGALTLSGDPSSSLHAATKQYVDSVAAGLDPKASVRVATTANITLSGTQTIDGVAVIAGDRVLVKNQSTGANNGIYVVAAGAWSRASDADTSAEVTAGMFMFVDEGTAGGNKGWLLTTNNPIVLGTTALTFEQFTAIADHGDLQGLADDDHPQYIKKVTTQAGTVGAPTATTLWSIQPTDTGKAPFEVYLGGTTFNGTYDTVLYQGYNASRGNNTEPSARWVIEQDYNTNGSTHWFEAYLEFALAASASNVRPFYAYFNRSTGVSEPYISSQGSTASINIVPDTNGAAGGAQWSFARGGINVSGANAGMTYTTSGAKPMMLSVNDAGTQTMYALRHTSGNILDIGDISTSSRWASIGHHAVTSHYFKLGTSDTQVLYMDADAAIFTPTASTKKALIVRGAASQSQNIMEWQNSSNNNIATVTATGMTVGSTALEGNLILNGPAAAGGPYLTFSQNSTAKWIMYQAAGNNIYLRDAVNSRMHVTYSPAAAASASTTFVDKLVVTRGTSGQTANLQEWQSETSAVLAYVDSAGNIGAKSLVAGNASGGMSLAFQRTSGTQSWVIYSPDDPNLYIRDSINGRAVMAFQPSATNPSIVMDGGTTIRSQAASGNPLILVGKGSSTATISNKALTSNIATLTTSAAHGFTAGKRVYITGVDATFNGSYTIASTPTSTTFTYACVAANVSSVAASGSAIAGTQTGNFFDIYNGTTVEKVYSIDQWGSATMGIAGDGRTGAFITFPSSGIQSGSNVEGKSILWAGNIVGQTSVEIGPSGQTNYGPNGFKIYTARGNGGANTTLASYFYQGDDVANSYPTVHSGLVLNYSGTWTQGSNLGVLDVRATLLQNDATTAVTTPGPTIYTDGTIKQVLSKPANIGHFIKGASSQTANLVEIQQSDTTVVAKFASDGALTVRNGITSVFGTIVGQNGDGITLNSQGSTSNTIGNTNGSTSGVSLLVSNSIASSTVPVMKVKGGATPTSTADLVQFQNSSSSVLSRITSAGALQLAHQVGVTSLNSVGSLANLIYLDGTNDVYVGGANSNGVHFESAVFIGGSYRQDGSASGSFLSMKNTAGAPSTNPTGGAILYADGGAFKVRQSDGTSFTISAPGAASVTYPLDNTFALSTDYAWTFDVTSDANLRFRANAAGKIEWGDGTAVVDTNLYRDAANRLKTDDVFASADGIYAVHSTGNQTGLGLMGPGGQSGISFAAGDSAIYLSSSGNLRTQAVWNVENNIYARAGVSSQVGIGNVGPSSQAGLSFGTSSPANLYFSAASTLKTDSNFIVGGQFTLSDANNIVFGTTTGTIIGTGTTQKIGFWGATAVVQTSGSTDILAGLVTIGLRAASSNPPLNMGSGALTAGASTLGATTVTTLGTGTITISDAANIVLNTTTGTKIGTATTQKLAFYNSTPVVQPAGSTDVLASLVTLGLRAASSNPPLDLGTGAITSGAITASGAVLISAGTVSAPGLAFSADADGSGTGIYRSAADTIAFAANGVNILTISSSSGTLIKGAASGDTVLTTGATSADLWLGNTNAGDTGKILVERNITMDEGKNILLGTTTGTKIGTSTAQKLAFYNSTPIVQPSAVTARVALQNLGLGASLTEDIPASTLGYVNHGATAGTARPSGYAAIHWVGSVEPTNATNGDLWTNTA